MSRATWGESPRWPVTFRWGGEDAQLANWACKTNRYVREHFPEYLHPWHPHWQEGAAE
jgi:hypothetical protein